MAQSQPLRIHAICLALNEELFISEQLKTLYPFCSGISILSQYDRDWYGKGVDPDATIRQVLEFPDPEGKISLVVRRWNDEAAARNHELLAISNRPDRKIIPHASPRARISEFHEVPDYFLIVDADEFYDPDTVSDIIEYLAERRPRGMRVRGYTYLSTWNRRVPVEKENFCHFGFLKPGILFEQLRVVSWNEFRLRKLLDICKLPDISAQLFGFCMCPEEVGVFHHGSWLGTLERLRSKFMKSSHPWANSTDFIDRIRRSETVFVPTTDLPRNIQRGDWPTSFFDEV